MESLVIEGKNYISSKRAAKLMGYTQDYIGQLARSGKISAKRVSGVWYVSEDELSGIPEKKERFIDDLSNPSKSEIANEINLQNQSSTNKDSITLDEVDYISSKRAARIMGYTQDYIGQLARSGKIEARQIGRGWYIPRSTVYKKIEENKKKKSVDASVTNTTVEVSSNVEVSLNKEKKPVDSQKEALKDLIVFKNGFDVTGTKADVKISSNEKIPTAIIEKPQKEEEQKRPKEGFKEKQEENNYYYPSFLNTTYSFDNTPLVPTPKRSYKSVLYQIVAEEKENESEHTVAIRRVQAEMTPTVQKQELRRVQRVTKDILKPEGQDLAQRLPMSLMRTAFVGVVVLLFVSIVTFIPSVSVFNSNTTSLKAEVSTSVSKTSLIETIISILGSLFENKIEYKAK